MKNLIYKILKFFHLLPLEETEFQSKATKEPTIYKLKPIMSQYEYKFYNILKELEPNYAIIPQLNLASIIYKENNNRYYNDLFRNIDFAIFTKDLKRPLLLIEINDATHEQYKRKDRDLKVQNICNTIGIRLIKFYSTYPNEKDYVLRRVINELNKQTCEIEII